MKDTIVFCLKVDNEESYAEIAKFIYKCENKLVISDTEVERVTYKYYFKNNNNEMKVWAQILKKDIKTFFKINEPQSIKNITSHYEILYCIYVDEKSDILDLSNLYLIKQHYSDLNMLTLIPCNRGRYHTVSQFLYGIGENDQKFYNECFYDDYERDNNVKKGQINRIEFSRKFTPLQIINKSNINRLFQGCKSLITAKTLDSMFTKETETGEYNDLLEGSVKILKETKKKNPELFDKQYISIFQNLDVLSFVLLCYVICEGNEKISVSLMKKYAFQMHQYSSAIRQLAENIVFHSKTKCGIMAIRLHSEASLYISEKYQVEDLNDKLLEIVVCDFCRDNSLGNIADNFISNLEDDKIRLVFNGMSPKDFFDHDSNDLIKEAWGEFYHNPENIGKHFGLQIFQSVVSRFGGIFGAESHSSYVNMPGDSFLSYGENKTEVCMPGTKYHIVFPIENVQISIKNQDLSLDSGINIGNRICEYLQYSVGEIFIQNKYDIFTTQQQKNQQILQMAEYIRSEAEKLKKDIIYISLESMESYMGEIIAKALTMALFQLKQNQKIVLYQCSDDLKKNIFETMRIFYHNTDLEGMFYERDVQLILYSKNFEEIVLDLGSIQNTDSINAYISHMKCVNSTEGYLEPDLDGIDLDKGAQMYIPCDILKQVEVDGKKQTLFEHYTEGILYNSIQEYKFGCQLEHTHMRLGSTIHIDKFYEAEILFGNRLFVSRFALLLVKDMKDDIKDIPKLTLYGYGTYSETVLVQMVEMIYSLYPEKESVDYIILEREEERRGFLHKDRIRYNQHFKDREERVNYFKDRKIIITVLINSTLKTHSRLINMFREENDKSITDNEWLVKNYAVLLVGNHNNSYWELDGRNVKLSKEQITPVPQYFIQVDADYQEPLECEQCFPQNPIAEIPLIEVNAASTIPNQAFGIVENKPIRNLKLDSAYIEQKENDIKYLKNQFIYGHVHRNENHFLYYFKTEDICIKQKDKIESSLREWKDSQKEEGQQYNIIVSPMHFSNAGFVEMVNSKVFNGNAILLRIDFDKEYRCNAYAKYSYLRSYIEQLSQMTNHGVVCVHYVDDSIISGRTFFRAKSLLKSILGTNDFTHDSVEIRIFDKVFVLVDRNSSESRNQYVNNVESDFYAFVTVNISSLRNYGDSCVYCNLKKEAALLYSTASTKGTADYWKRCMDKKFQLYSLEEYNESYGNFDNDKHYRRLFCTHMAQCVLQEDYHGNSNIQATYLILKLLNTDYQMRGKDRYEYFLSYLKCISRPFLVFKKAIKEAVFDIMLILMDAVVLDKSIRQVVKGIENEKPYLGERRLILQFNELDKNILQSTGVSKDEKKDLVKLLMKQLTELKSNYIIRPEKMDAIFAFMSGEEQQTFRQDYMSLIDRLVGGSSDTNKGIWLDEKIIHNEFVNVPEDFRIWVLLENTRTFRDGIQKLYKKISGENFESKEFAVILNDRITELEALYDYKRTLEMFVFFERNNRRTLDDYLSANNTDTELPYNIGKRIETFLINLPDLETINAKAMANVLKKEKEKEDWWEIFDCIKEYVEEDYTEREGNQNNNNTRLKLQELLSTELDVYQFANFYRLLKEEGYAQEEELTEDGADMIACCLGILVICEDKQLDILKKIRLLALLFKVILGAQKVQFIIENKIDSNLNRWKQDIEKIFNEIIDRIDEEKKVEKISIKEKKQYFVIVEKAGKEDNNTKVSDKTEKLIEFLEYQNHGQNNYIIDTEQGAVIWKLENNQRSIWINIENDNWCGSVDKCIIARAFRKVMMFYQELQSKIFNPENDDYINEISYARKELSIYDSKKTLTHTKDELRKMLFNKVQGCFQEPQNCNHDLENYPSYVLKLLSDTNISEYYRRALRKDFYDDKKGIPSPASWAGVATLISDGKELTHCIGEKKDVCIRLKVEDICSDDLMLCRNTPNAVQDLVMMLISVIFNAAEQDRGKEENENKGVQSDGKSVIIVHISKKEGYLIIKNECEKIIDLEQVKRKLHHIPDSEEDGISLWSVNCYIKRCINSLIMAKLKEIERNISENPDSIGNMEYVKKWIETLMSEKYDIQPDVIKEDEKSYFIVKLPIFMEIYQFDEKEKEISYE